MHREWYQNLTTEPPKDKEWSDRFAFGLPKIKDSAVIVTCRKEEFAQWMVHAGRIFRPDKLEEKEAWLVFKRSFEEAMNIALKKDMKLESELYKNRVKEKEEKPENDMKDIKREFEDKSKELEQIEAALKEKTNEVVRLNEELVEAEKLLEEARRDYEKEKSLEEIDKEISANNEHLDKVKEEARKDHEKEKSLEGTDKEIGANNEHLDSEKHESEDSQKVILDEIAKLKEKKEHITVKKEIFERSKNKVEEIKKTINDKKKEKENKEKERSVVDEEIKKKQKIVNEANEKVGQEEQLKSEFNTKIEKLKKRENDLNDTIDRIIKDLKLDKMQKQIRDKCLGLPVALIEAAKGLAFDEYKKLYHSEDIEN